MTWDTCPSTFALRQRRENWKLGLQVGALTIIGGLITAGGIVFVAKFLPSVPLSEMPWQLISATQTTII